MPRINTFRTDPMPDENPVPKKTTTLKQRMIKFITKVIFYFFILSVGSVVFFKFVPIPFTLTMLDRKLDAMSAGEDSEIHYSWRSYSKISKEAGLAVVAAEDQLFPDHWGFDFESMGNAFSHNLKGKKIRGASTISQQVAKNVFLWQERSYIRKLLEVYFTVLIEAIWGKERILEVYLNVAEMGKMTFGVEAAAQRFYGKPAKELTRTESARIAAVLPSPNKWSITKPGNYVTRRTNQIARQMRALGGQNYLAHLRSF